MNSQVLRLLDANANRAREALRVIEDYARFILNDQNLCAQLKHLRHDLADATQSIVPEAILHRDTPGDVGTTTKAAGELTREDTAHVITAAGKRLGEALRTLEEFLKTTDPTAATKIESIRYRFYDLEHQIAQTLRPSACGLAGVQLYVLITESICKRPWQEAAEQAIQGGADSLQLREKSLDSGEFLNRARQFVTLCRRHNVISIINDRPDIAILSDADGVHVGQNDLPPREVRKLIGTQKILGVSTHNIEQARQAVLDGADYIGVGPIFPSPTKPRDFLPGLDYARQVAKEIHLPAIAIAGITLENVDKVLATGIKGVAVTASVVGCDDIKAAAKNLKAKLVGQTFLSVTPPANPVGQTFLSASSPQQEVSLSPQVTKKRRHLPHWTMAGATYFITFRIKHGEFTQQEAVQILDHIKSGDGKFYQLLGAVVMPDHAHALLEPFPQFPLSRIMKGTKGVTANLINASRGTSGTIWQDESFDRIMRDQSEFEEKLSYIVDNPVKKELVSDPWDYPALYVKFE
jgi:thiamine-phosphate pyrophosphorylase